MALVVDIVPNHLGVADPQANPAWWDVLRHGPSSRFARWFDITGWPLRLPVLADSSDALADLRLMVTCSVTTSTPSRWRRARPAAPHSRYTRRSTTGWSPGGPTWVTGGSSRSASLAAVRVEDPEVFDATHGEVLRWVAEGEVDGLRVDHPDGLTDPAGYLHRLRQHAPDTWIVVEKILEPGEELPASWPVAGTTGYDALAEVDGVLVDPAGEATLPPWIPS